MNAILNGSSILPFLWGFNKNKEKEVSLKGHTILSVIYTSVKLILQTISDSRLV